MPNFMYYEAPKFSKPPQDTPNNIGGVYKSRKLQAMQSLKEQAENEIEAFINRANRSQSQREERRKKRQ